MAPAPHARSRGRHRTSRRRPPRAAYACLVVLVFLGLAVAGGVHFLTATGPSHRAGQPAASGVSPTPEHTAVRTFADARATLRHGPVRVTSEGFLSWALLDRQSGRIDGSTTMRAPGQALSLIRPWLAADHLRRTAARGHTPTQARLRQLRAVVRGDARGPADKLYEELGGAGSIRRLVRVCGLSDSRPGRDGWRGTLVSARDTVRVGACLADGRAAGARWTGWLLDEMRTIRGTGDFGARRVLPAPVAATVAARNGWLLADGGRRWHVNCLAVGDGWVLGVLVRYPKRLGLRHGQRLCGTVADQLIAR